MQPATCVPITHCINTGDAAPTYTTNPRRFPAEIKKKAALAEEIKKIKEKGVIGKCVNSWCSTVNPLV